MPYDLKHNRKLPFLSAGNLYVLIVRPITREEWFRYFDSTIVEEQMVEGQLVRVHDNAAARLDLLTSVLVDAEGYATPDNKPLAEIDGWRYMIPVGHRAAVADKLFEIRNGSTLSSSPVVIGSERVVLSAYYGLVDSGTVGEKLSAVVQQGLVHRFRVPMIEQSRRYSRDQSRSRVIGGRNGKTQYLGAQKTLVELYDELVVGVEGYAVDGTPLTDDVSAIKLQMDALHKQQAAYLLFNPQDDE